MSPVTGVISPSGPGHCSQQLHFTLTLQLESICANSLDLAFSAVVFQFARQVPHPASSPGEANERPDLVTHGAARQLVQGRAGDGGVSVAK